MMKLISYEVIEKAVGGDTAALLAVQQHCKPYIAYLSIGDTDLHGFAVWQSRGAKAVNCFRPPYNYDYDRVNVTQ